MTKGTKKSKDKSIQELGGEAVKKKYGIDHFRELGKKSGEARRKRKEELERLKKQSNGK